MRLSAAVMLLALPGCAEMGRLFGDEPRPVPMELAPPPEAGQVTVLPVAGLPDLAAGDRLAAAMVDALDQQGVRASVFGSQPGKVYLSGEARAQAPAAAPASDGTGRMVSLALRWELAGADGRVIGRHADSASVDRIAWEAGTEAELRRLAAAMAPSIAKLLSSGKAEIAAAPPQAPARQSVIAVRAASGAPGDGNAALPLAMKRALSQLGLGLSAEEAQADALLNCTVSMAPAGTGQQKVSILWRLVRPDGGELGRIEQANTVPQGSLDGGWGPVALAVADAAAAGVLDLMPAQQAAAPAPSPAPPAATPPPAPAAEVPAPLPQPLPAAAPEPAPVPAPAAREAAPKEPAAPPPQPQPAAASEPPPSTTAPAPAAATTETAPTAPPPPPPQPLPAAASEPAPTAPASEPTPAAPPP